MPRILCLWFPNWPVQRLQNARPELKRQRIALYEQRQGLRVVASNHPDIRPGMPLAEASGALHELHDPVVDRETLVRVAEWCEQFSPLVALEEVERPESLFLDITGIAHVFQGEEAFVERIGRAFLRRGLEIRLAIADTPGMAWGVAHFGEAVCIVSSGDIAPFAQLPIAALRLPREMLDVLAELGIRCVAQLLNLPREGLTARLGPLLVERIDQALGNKAELVAPHRAIPEIIAERQFEFPLERKSTIEDVVTQMLAEITAALAIRQHGAIQLECTFGCQPEVKLLISLFEASGDPRHLLELLRMRLERTILPGPVPWLRLTVLLSARLICRQQELFAAYGKNHEREQALLIDRLSSRLGREAVVRAQPVADAQPEYAFRFEPLAGKKRVITQERKPRSTKKRKSEDSEQSARAPPERPLLLEPRPVPLEVLAVAPEGPPMQFRWQGEQHRTQRSWGPERIQTGWWRGRYIRRDYYRVESDHGQQYWLFRSRGQWFLHGIFD